MPRRGLPALAATEQDGRALQFARTGGRATTLTCPQHGPSLCARGLRCIFCISAPLLRLPDYREAEHPVVRRGASENSTTLVAEIASALLALVALLLLNATNCIGWCPQEPEQALTPRAEVVAPFREHLTSWEWQGTC